MTDPTQPGSGEPDDQPPAPQPGYGAPPPPEYGAPPPGTQPSPPPGYGAPPPGYQPPPPPDQPFGQQPGYGQPEGYGQPGYGAPQYGGYGGAPYKGQQLGLPPQGPNSLASQWMRLLARIIDWLILLIPTGILVRIITGENYAGMTSAEYSGKVFLGTLISVIVGGAYEIYFLTSRGATLGKGWLGIRVAQISDGQKPVMQTAVVRSAVGSVPGLAGFIGGVFQLVNWAWCLWDPNRQCLHDKAAKTVVVSTK